MKPSEQFRLFEAAMSPSATQEDLRALELLLMEDGEAVDRFVEFTQQDVELRHAFRIGLIGPHARPAATPTTDRHVPRRNAERRFWGQGGTIAVALAGLAVCVAIVLAPLGLPDAASERATPPSLPLAQAVYSRIPPAPVATLATHQGAKWEGLQLEDGQAISEGDQIYLVAGEARISMGFGAEITAKAPCALTFVAADRVELELGEVAVHVAEWARGFTVETAEMEVVDLGTTFTVSASPHASSETNVLKGQVRVSPRQRTAEDPRSVLVSEGEALRVDVKGQRSAREIAPGDLSAWGEWGNMAPYHPIGLHNTGHDIDVGDEDPNWRVIAGPADSFGEPQFAMVCVPDVRYLPNERESSQWISMANWRNATPNSVFTFQTTFDLTGYDLTTIQLFGRFLADNGIREVRVNGKPVELESWSDNVAGQEFQHPQFRTVNVTMGLITGTNVVEVDVWNGTFFQTAGPTPNPMALRVEWQAFGRKTSSPLEAKANPLWDLPAMKTGRGLTEMRRLLPRS